MKKFYKSIQISLPLILLTLLLTGCFNMNVYQTAPVLEKGEHITGVALDLIASNGNSAPGSLELHYREGLGHNWDAGAKLYGAPGLFTGLAADLKYQLVGPPFYVSSSVFSGVVNVSRDFEVEGGGMLLAGTKKFYSGYKLSFRDKVLDYNDNIDFINSDFLHNIFLGYRFGTGPYITPNIGLVFHKFHKNFLSNTFVLGLALQFD